MPPAGKSGEGDLASLLIRFPWCLSWLLSAVCGLPPAAAGQVAHAPSLPPALQAFRHLYVLAAQPRSVDAIDVDTKQARVHWGHSTCLARVAAPACPP